MFYIIIENKMYKILFILILLLNACSSFKENNKLAVPPIAINEIKIISN